MHKTELIFRLQKLEKELVELQDAVVRESPEHPFSPGPVDCLYCNVSDVRDACKEALRKIQTA